MSKLTITIGWILLLLFVAAPDTGAKPWRQITPLHSTAEDVATMAQACEKEETRCQFTLEDQEVMIILSGNTLGVLECKRVPKQTVLAVIIRLKTPKKLREFQVKNKRFKTFDPSSPPGTGYRAYYDAQDGFLINTYKGQVIGLVYLATQKDAHLCPEYYKDPKAFVAVGLLP